jgi:hypothetical protein
MFRAMNLLLRVLLSGTAAAAATALAASYSSRRNTGSYASALNATSHAVWGDEAARRNEFTWKYTGTGYALNYAGALFWALWYEALGWKRRRAPATALAEAAAVSAAAYVVDYHVVPRRLTPGFERRLPGRALAAVYVGLALGLSVRDILRR